MTISRIVLLGSGILFSVSCQSFNQPISNDVGFDPLGKPGGNLSKKKIDVQRGPSFSPGSFVETSIPDSAFFTSLPRGNATADKLLKKGESVKVISQEKSYVKVELDDGSVGFVPAMMLSQPISSNARVVAGSGAPTPAPLVIPELPDPIEDPGDPNDLPPPVPALSDTTPVAPLPAPELPNPVVPVAPELDSGDEPTIPVVPPQPAVEPEEDAPPPLPLPAQ